MPITNEIEKKYYSRNEVASYTSLSKKWLERAAWGGYGPPYIKVVGRVLYPIDELDEWLRSHPLRCVNKTDLKHDT